MSPDTTSQTFDTDAARQSQILDRLTASARDLVPLLRERAAQAEAERKLPQETFRDLQATGLFKVFQPRHFGGFELDYGPAQLAIGAELGRGCGSTAWVWCVVACHSWMLGMFSEQAQDDVWGKNPDALMSSGVVPEGGGGTREKGGLRISGRWRFSSGVDVADWALLGAPIMREGGPPDMQWCLVPRADFTVEDTWHVNGLKGTGSNDIVIKGAFVPDHRLAGFGQMIEGVGPGAAKATSHIYRLPLFSVFPYNLVGPALGIARGAFELYTEEVRKRPPRPVGPPVPGSVDPLMYRLAEAGAQIDSSAALLENDAREFNHLMRKGTRLDALQRGRYQRDLAYASQQFTNAIDTLFYMSGAHGLFDGNPMQRAFRDIHAINAHVGLKWESCSTNFVKAALGIQDAAH
jgi:3-hydroxy-9,10-secoandrosta-1,3,5(10)-triene-9,17-dione monooxygenase